MKNRQIIPLKKESALNQRYGGFSGFGLGVVKKVVFGGKNWVKNYGKKAVRISVAKTDLSVHEFAV